MRHFLHFFPKQFIEMQRHDSLLEKLQSFDQIDDFSCCFTNWATFWPLLLKSSSKHQNMVVCSKKPSIWPKLSNFSNKVPYLCVSMNFSRKSCKKCLISWKSTKNHTFGKIFATFWTNYDVFAFRWTFQENVGKSASFSDKVRKIIYLAKSLQLLEQTTMSLHIDELFREKLQKVPHFVKKHEKSSIWPKLATFPTNYHLLEFQWTFEQKVAKSCSIRGKARKIIDLAKTF